VIADASHSDSEKVSEKVITAKPVCYILHKGVCKNRPDKMRYNRFIYYWTKKISFLKKSLVKRTSKKRKLDKITQKILSKNLHLYT